MKMCAIYSYIVKSPPKINQTTFQGSLVAGLQNLDESVIEKKLDELVISIITILLIVVLHVQGLSFAWLLHSCVKEFH